MGRGLSPHQLRILRALSKHGETTVVELTDIFAEEHPNETVEEELARVRETDYFRNLGFACRRAIWNLRRRGLVEETWMEVEWQRRGARPGLTLCRGETLAAARLTEAGEELIAAEAHKWIDPRDELRRARKSG
jgi:hypothetical protein